MALTSISRRECLTVAAAGFGGIVLPPLSGAAVVPSDDGKVSATSKSLDALPQQDPTLVREMVGVSHGKIDRVKELLQQMPRLANAAIDHGFGDWESALGAASHVGRRDIAELTARTDHPHKPTRGLEAMRRSPWWST